MGDHDVGATRHNPGVTATSPPATPTWTKALPESHLPSDPAVGPTHLYLGIGNHEPTPAKTRIAAFDPEDGTRKWERSLAYTGDATPTLARISDGERTLFALSGQDNSNTGPAEAKSWHSTQ